METLIKLGVVMLVAVLLFGTVALLLQVWQPVQELASSGMSAVDAVYSYQGHTVDGSPRSVFDRIINYLLPDGALVALGAAVGGMVALFLAFLAGRWLYALVAQS